MTTISEIVYDVVLLTAADTNALLRQIIFRLDRAQPNGETQVTTAAAATEATNLMDTFVAQLTNAGFAAQAAQVQAILDGAQ